MNYQTAQQTIALQLLQIQSATENLRVQTQRYNIGTALQVDVTTAQAALDLARFNLIQRAPRGAHRESQYRGPHRPRHQV